MKKYFNVLYLVALLNSCLFLKGQQVLPLNNPLKDIPMNSYVKDLHHELDSYTGVYKANFQGKEITLYVTKIENKPEKSAKKNYYLDVLDVKYIVKDSSGNTLQDTKNNNLPGIELYSTRIRSYDKSVILFYSGTNCGVGWGDVFLKKINNTQFSWEYRPDDMIIMPGKCPGNQDLTIYLPKTKDLIFTKQ